MRSTLPLSSGKQRRGRGAKRLGEHHDGSYGVYMAHKIQKLRNQNASLIRSSNSSSIADAIHLTPPPAVNSTNRSTTPVVASATSSPNGIFRGVHIYVDGYTTPSKEELRALLLRHGGGFEHYETPRVTHIIATHLPASKMQQLKKMKKPTPVAHPDWVVQCVAQQRLLPLQPFVLQGFADPTQRSLFGRNNILHLALATQSLHIVQSECVIPAAVEAQSRPLSPPLLPRTVDPDVFADTAAAASADALTASSNTTPAATTRLAFSDTDDLNDDSDDNDDASDRFSDGRDDGVDSVDTNSTDVEAAVPPASSRSSSVLLTTVQPHARLDRQDVVLSPSHRRVHSTRDGAAAFVRHYFRTSRLHHIGTWRSTFATRSHEFAALYRGPTVERAPATSHDRVLLHVDMDCFFVAVALRAHLTVPPTAAVAVAHSGDAAGASEIASCNYVARAAGVSAGMVMHTAKLRCPDLVVLPYDFAAIERVTFQVYSIFFTFTPFVQAMSCDEALLEFAPGTDGQVVADAIRQQILAVTQCCASVGIASNVLLAKLASRRAKPNGVCVLTSREAADAVLLDLDVRDLPGVGRQLGAKLQALGIERVQQLRAWSATALAPHVGHATAVTLVGFVYGKDDRAVDCDAATATVQRKSVSAVVNFGIRFDRASDAAEFLDALADELAARLDALGLRTTCLTLQLKCRSADAPVEPRKFMGHGKCDNVARRHVLASPTRDARAIARVCCTLLTQVHVDVTDLRGVGIQATKLVRDDSDGSNGSIATKSALLTTWLREPTRSSSEQPTAKDVEVRTDANTSRDVVDVDGSESDQEERVGDGRDDAEAESTESAASREFSLGLSQVNMSVLNELPAWVQDEVLATYRPRNAPSVLPTSTAAAATVLDANSSSWHRVGLTRAPMRATSKQPMRGRPRMYGLSSTSTARRPLASRHGATDASATAASAASDSTTNALDDIRMSQIDSDVYYALPFTLRREIDRNAKRSHAGVSVAQAVAARARRTADTTATTLPIEPAAAASASLVKRRLQSIDELWAIALDAVRVRVATASVDTVSSHDSSHDSSCDAFDAVYARILVEVERRALDRALCMLRFVRRKCVAAAAAAADDEGSADGAKQVALVLQTGFNHVLALVNRDVQQHFHGVLAAAAVAPL